MKSIKLFLFFLMSSLILEGQGTHVANIFPPSPNAVSLGIFGEVPVGLTTGIPHINIPIYSYEGVANKLKLNLSLNYHGGGIKVEEIASNVGLGWALSGGGVISRTVFGLPDEQMGIRHYGDTVPDGVGTVYRVAGCLIWPGGLGSHAYPDNSSSPCDSQEPSCTDEDTFYDYVFIQRGIRDGQFDLYSYNFEGYSGKFIIGLNDSILQMPQTNLRIEYVNDYKFIITTPEGIRYTFDDVEYDQINASLPFLSSWYLSKIDAPFTADTIGFTYNKPKIEYRTFGGQTVYHPAAGSDSIINSEYTHGFEQASQYSNALSLDSITLPGGITVRFHYDTNTRKDLDVGDFALRQIIISDANDQYGYHLNYSYTAALNYEGNIIPYDAPSSSFPDVDRGYKCRLRLDSIYKFSNSVQIPSYRFVYDDSHFLPGRNSFAQDYWGFYNGHRDNSPYFVPKLHAGVNGAFREVDSSYAKASSLKKIIYPTGGYTEFQYESNKVNNRILGGLRVKKIIDSDGLDENKNVITEYSYPNGGNYTEYVFYYPYWISGEEFIAQTSYSNRTMGFSQGSPVTYNNIEVCKTKHGQSNGMTKYYFNNEGFYLFQHSESGINTSFPYVPIQYLSWADNKLEYEKYYTSDNLLVKEIRHYYDFKVSKVKDSNYKSLKATLVAGPCLNNNSDCEITPGSALFNIPPETDYAIYNAIHYYPYTGRTDLIKTRETDYSVSGNIVKETTYSYDQVYHQLKRIRQSDNKVDSIVSYIKYPYDFISVPNTPYGTMVNSLHMLSPKIETIDSIYYNFEGNFLQSTKINYNNWGNNVIAPNSVQTKTGSNAYETRINYIYDIASGNIISQSKEEDNTVSYIFGYKNTFPVIKAENISHGILQTAIISSLPSGFSTLEELLTSSNGIKNLRLSAQKHLWKTFCNNLLGQSSLSNTEISIFTYSPLFGVTSQTDQNSLTIYYEYDSIGQLYRIKDNNQHLIKQYNYNYRP